MSKSELKRKNIQAGKPMMAGMKVKQPKHCKGCISFHSAGRKDPPDRLKDYNAWCCTKGAPTRNTTIGWCKLNNSKRMAKHSYELEGA